MTNCLGIKGQIDHCIGLKERKNEKKHFKKIGFREFQFNLKRFKVLILK